MASSMTGYARAELMCDQWVGSVEIRSLNHRFLDISIHTDRQYRCLEECIRRCLRDTIVRGRLEVVLSISPRAEQTQEVRVNTPLLRGYAAALAELCSTAGLEEKPRLDHYLTLTGLLEPKPLLADTQELESLVQALVSEAVEQLNTMRQAEGTRLAADLREKLRNLEERVQQIEAAASSLVPHYQKLLQERVSRLLEGTSLSEEQFAAELALFAARCSIDEEIVRLHSHIEQGRQLLDGEQAMGRRLDFLLQEMIREINTIASKAQNTTIARHIVESKNEVEKMREQVQNIE